MSRHFKLTCSLLVFISTAISIELAAPHPVWASSCEASFSSVSVVSTAKARTENIFREPVYRERALKIMMEGSLNLSRTKTSGRRFYTPDDVPDEQIPIIAEANFEKAARYILEHFETLALNRETAVTLNRMLTERLVPEDLRGKYDVRTNGFYYEQIDEAVGRSPHDFYDVWLESSAAKELFLKDPVTFAEILHNTISSLDSFVDGNGRLARLFSDLALIKAGIGPAFYTSMKDYFDRGNSRAEVTREVRKQYFSEIVQVGTKTVCGPEGQSRTKP